MVPPLVAPGKALDAKEDYGHPRREGAMWALLGILIAWWICTSAESDLPDGVLWLLLIGTAIYLTATRGIAGLFSVVALYVIWRMTGGRHYDE